MGRELGLLSLFDYKEHGVVDAIVPTKIRRGLPVRPITAVRQPPAGLGSPDLHFLRCPLPAPDGPCVLTRPLGEDGINNNNKFCALCGVWAVRCAVRKPRTLF